MTGVQTCALPISRDDEPKTYAKLSDVPADQLEKLREERPQDYERLYKAEYGHDIPKK